MQPFKIRTRFGGNPFPKFTADIDQKTEKYIWEAQNLRILGKKREGIVTFKIGDFCNLSYFYTKT